MQQAMRADKDNSPKSSASSRAGLFLKRALAVISVFTAIYLIVGSYFYGEWWFGLLWDAKLRDSQYLANGFFYLFDNHFTLTVITILSLFVISFLAAIFKSRILPLVDRFWLRMVTGSLVTIFVTALFIYHNFKDTYIDVFSDDYAARFRAQMEAVTSDVTKPRVLPPIDFKYLDHSRTEALYSEILPDLIEKERSVETGSKNSIKGSASAGAVGGEVSLEKGTQIKSSFQRPDFSPERKCIELMNFSIQSGRAHVYYSDILWLINRRNRDIVDGVEERRNAPIEEVLKKIHPIGEPETAEEIAEAHQKEKQFAAELHNELLTLQGLVFIEGEFKFNPTTADQQVIAYQFSEKPSVRFQITLPKSSGGDQMTAGRKTWLRVFAYVDRALDQNGNIGMHAIAIF